MTQRIIPLLLLTFSCGYLSLANLIPLDPWSAEESVGPRTLPIVYGSLLLILSSNMLFRGAPILKRGYRWQPLTVIAICIIIFAGLIPYAGLWLTVAFFLCGSLGILGERRVLVLIAAPFATALLGWFVINVLLNVYIHPGSWWL